MISNTIQQLVNYGLDTGLIQPDDEIYIRNQLLMTMGLDSFEEPEGDCYYVDLESILTALVDDAVARGVCEDNSVARDLFDTKLMGVLTPRPSIVRANFWDKYDEDGPQAATDWFYQFCKIILSPFPISSLVASITNKIISASGMLANDVSFIVSFNLCFGL